MWARGGRTLLGRLCGVDWLRFRCLCARVRGRSCWNAAPRFRRRASRSRPIIRPVSPRTQPFRRVAVFRSRPLSAPLLCPAAPQDCRGAGTYRKIDGEDCAEACIPKKLGNCPSSWVIKGGKLQKGNCADLGYTTAHGTLNQKAGICGKIL